MKSNTISSSNAYSRTQAATPNTAWSELFAAMPIGIVYHAVRELIQKRNHKRLVLQAFKR